MNKRTELLELPAGTALQVQATVPDNAPRYSVRLIGQLPGASLVVTAPMHDGKVQLVREGQRFAVRVLKGERIVGFIAQVLHVSLKPYAHLHLEYPTEFEQIVVRNASRVSSDIPVLVRNTEQPDQEESFHPAIIIDLSETGAKIGSTMHLGKPGEMLHLKFSVVVGGVREDLMLLGDIRNTTERSELEGHTNDGPHTVGIQFRALNRYQQVLLHAWVNHRVLQDMTGA